MTGRFVVALVCASACTKAPATPPPTTPVQAEGGVFEGPAVGGRGGSYRHTLCPDGRWIHWCLDADCERGTWRREGAVIILRSEVSEPVGAETRLVLSADGKTLGDSTTSGGPFQHNGPADPGKCGP